VKPRTDVGFQRTEEKKLKSGKRKQRRALDFELWSLDAFFVNFEA
jgi:hypothetical protein